MPLIENVHPLQGGYVHRRVHRTRRPGLPSENVLLFYPRHWSRTVFNVARLAAMVCRVNAIRRRVEREHAARPYSDVAITRFPREAAEQLELLWAPAPNRIAIAAE